MFDFSQTRAVLDDAEASIVSVLESVKLYIFRAYVLSTNLIKTIGHCTAQQWQCRITGPTESPPSPPSETECNSFIECIHRLMNATEWPSHDAATTSTTPVLPSNHSSHTNGIKLPIFYEKFSTGFADDVQLSQLTADPTSSSITFETSLVVFEPPTQRRATWQNSANNQVLAALTLILVLLLLAFLGLRTSPSHKSQRPSDAAKIVALTERLLAADQENSGLMQVNENQQKETGTLQKQIQTLIQTARIEAAEKAAIVEKLSALTTENQDTKNALKQTRNKVDRLRNEKDHMCTAVQAALVDNEKCQKSVAVQACLNDNQQTPQVNSIGLQTTMDEQRKTATDNKAVQAFLETPQQEPSMLSTSTQTVTSSETKAVQASLEGTEDCDDENSPEQGSDDAVDPLAERKVEEVIATVAQQSRVERLLCEDAEAENDIFAPVARPVVNLTPWKTGSCGGKNVADIKRAKIKSYCPRLPLNETTSALAQQEGAAFVDTYNTFIGDYIIVYSPFAFGDDEDHRPKPKPKSRFSDLRKEVNRMRLENVMSSCEIDK